MNCSAYIPRDIDTGCRATTPLTLDEKRQLMERSKWIENVIRIMDMPRWKAENLWVRIQVANHNENLRKS